MVRGKRKFDGDTEIVEYICARPSHPGSEGDAQ